jgi:hypothetical protein
VHVLGVERDMAHATPEEPRPELYFASDVRHLRRHRQAGEHQTWSSPGSATRGGDLQLRRQQARGSGARVGRKRGGLKAQDGACARGARARQGAGVAARARLLRGAPRETTQLLADVDRHGLQCTPTLHATNRRVYALIRRPDNFTDPADLAGSPGQVMLVLLSAGWVAKGPKSGRVAPCSLSAAPRGPAPAQMLKLDTGVDGMSGVTDTESVTEGE